MPIDWNKPTDPHFITSKQGYNISKNRSASKVRYGAWPPKPPRGEVHHALDYRSTLAAAQRLCEKHYEKRRRS